NMKKVKLPECFEVIVCGDSDEVGIASAKEAARALADQGHRVSISKAPKPFKDWNEALCQDADPAGLSDLIFDRRKTVKARAVREVTMEEFLDIQFPPREFLNEPWLETSSSVMIHGYRGEGKTWFGLSVAYALATGEPLLGWNVRQARVLYIDGE